MTNVDAFPDLFPQVNYIDTFQTAQKDSSLFLSLSSTSSKNPCIKDDFARDSFCFGASPVRFLIITMTRHSTRSHMPRESHFPANSTTVSSFERHCRLVSTHLNGTTAGAARDTRANRRTKSKATLPATLLSQHLTDPCKGSRLPMPTTSRLHGNQSAQPRNQPRFSPICY